MQKTATAALFLVALASILPAQAQTADGGVNLATTIVTFALLGVFFAVIGFAAYRLIKKWSGGSESG